MTDKEKIRNEVERMKAQLIRGACASQIAMETCCKEEAYNEVIAILDTLQEKLVSEKLEEALAREWQGYNDRGAATVDSLEDNTQELAFAKGFYRGAKWGKNQAKVEIQAQSMALAHGCPKESVSEDLGEYINELSKQFPEVSFAKLSRIAVRVAKWQKDRMKDATEAT